MSGSGGPVQVSDSSSAKSFDSQNIDKVKASLSLTIVQKPSGEPCSAFEAVLQLIEAGNTNAQIAKHELIRDSRLTLDEIECVRQYRQSERQEGATTSASAPSSSSARAARTPSPPTPYGLRQWEETRAKWRTPRPGYVKKPMKEVLDFGMSYDELLGHYPIVFDQKISLPEMIEFLLEEWDDEGLLGNADYD